MPRPIRGGRLLAISSKNAENFFFCSSLRTDINLRFVSAHYGVRTDEVVRLRGQHSNFINVTQEISSPDYRARRAEIQKQNNARNNDRGRGQGRSNRGGNK